MAVNVFNEAEFRQWLTERLAEHLKRNAEDIDPDTPLADYGLDSLYALAVVAEIEDHLEIAVEATILWDHPSVAALTTALAATLEAP
jgi:acyl carrier protein